MPSDSDSRATAADQEPPTEAAAEVRIRLSGVSHCFRRSKLIGWPNDFVALVWFQYSICQSSWSSSIRISVFRSEINVTAIDALSVADGRYGAIFWVAPKDVRKAATLLGMSASAAAPAGS